MWVMQMRVRFFGCLAGFALACSVVANAAPVVASTTALAPNLVPIHTNLITAGQPSAEQLGKLAAQGFEAVIYLAPPTVPDAVRDEALIIAQQGLLYINLPVRFGNPTEKDFQTFAALLTSLGSRKVLVHCQVNMRASSLVFLYRAIIGKEDPHQAYQSVAAVWVPDGPWKKLMSEQLKKARIDFEPY